MRDGQSNHSTEIGEYPVVVKESGWNPRPVGILKWYPKAMICVALCVYVFPTTVEIISTGADLKNLIDWVLFTDVQ